MLHLLVIVDGRAGHDKQTFGVIEGLRHHQPVSVTTMEVDLTPRGKIKDFLQFLFPSLVPLRKKEREADLILCTGGKTHFCALARKRKYQLPLCTCMAPGAGFRALFDLCFIPEHDGIAAAANVVPTLGPPNLCIDNGQHDPDLGLILVGGEDKNMLFWPEERLLGEIETVVARSKQKRWVLSSSPRTPKSTVEKLRAFAADRPGVLFFHYRDTPSGWIEEQYARAEVAWITSDSMSMIYEALTAGCKIGLFLIDWKNGHNKFAGNEQLLQERSLAVAFAEWQQNGEYCSSGKLNEARRCADIIMEKWWTENLL